ncbi:MAG: hypothetical protein HDR26_09105 [Lachnospiraceae bacterium]|nr:hypothetical protein [Lachnospiraceae bacterium]
MGIIKWLSGKKEKAEKTQEDVQQTVYEREKTDFRNPDERKRYLTNCLEQIEDAEKELALLRGEYNLVTAYLTDMEEIEALPEEESEELRLVANKLLLLEKERGRYQGRKGHMSDTEFKQMESQEEEIEEGIAKIREAEKYHKLVQQDLNRLDGERNAYQYRHSELQTMMVNLRGMAIICLTALGACLLMLAVLQFGFEMDTKIGFLISVGAAAVAIAVFCIKYTDAQREIGRVEKAANKLILLQNKVKIRYVNSVNLLDYLYMKYQVDSSQKLEGLWKKYEHEKEERRQYAEAEAKTAYYREQMFGILKRYQLRDPGRWLRQAAAIVDSREMVEIRHGLIERRQALREQMEYNQKVAGAAEEELAKIEEDYPVCREEIAALRKEYMQAGS